MVLSCTVRHLPTVDCLLQVSSVSCLLSLAAAVPFTSAVLFPPPLGTGAAFFAFLSLTQVLAASSRTWVAHFHSCPFAAFVLLRFTCAVSDDWAAAENTWLHLFRCVASTASFTAVQAHTSNSNCKGRLGIVWLISARPVRETNISTFGALASTSKTPCFPWLPAVYVDPGYLLYTVTH
jgi:hypothetical protein